MNRVLQLTRTIMEHICQHIQILLHVDAHRVLSIASRKHGGGCHGFFEGSSERNLVPPRVPTLLVDSCSIQADRRWV
jgi:hypothetical protein